MCIVKYIYVTPKSSAFVLIFKFWQCSNYISSIIHLYLYSHAYICIQSRTILINIFLNFSDTDLVCRHCSLKLPNVVETIINHCKLCKSLPRKNRTFNYMCIFCTFHTVHKFRMTDHMRNNHMGDKPFMCTYCPFSSGKLSLIKQHVREKHNIELIEG